MKKTPSNQRALSPERREELLGVLQTRFEQNPRRHPGLRWADVATRLVANAEKRWSLGEMGKTGGEPDVFGQDKQSGEYTTARSGMTAAGGSAARSGSSPRVSYRGSRHQRKGESRFYRGLRG